MSDYLRYNTAQLQALLARNKIDFTNSMTVPQLRTRYSEFLENQRRQAENNGEDAPDVNAAGDGPNMGADVVPIPNAAGDAVNIENNAHIDDIGSERSMNWNQMNENASVRGDHQDEEDLDREIALLEKRRRIAQLRRELAEFDDIERDPPRRRHYDFAQIDGTIAKFTGDDTYSVDKWISDFEIAVSPLRCPDDFKLLCARRLMDGTAKIWLRTIIAHTWTELMH